MLKFKTTCAVLANLSSNLLNEVGLSLFRYFEVGLRVCDIVVNKYVRYLISWWVLVLNTVDTLHKITEAANRCARSLCLIDRGIQSVGGTIVCCYCQLGLLVSSFKHSVRRFHIPRYVRMSEICSCYREHWVIFQLSLVPETAHVHFYI